MSENISITALASVDINTINKDDLVDVSGFTFDNTVPQEQRAARILETIINPYCFRVGDMGVKLEFSENAPTLHDMFTNFLIRKKSGLAWLPAGAVIDASFTCNEDAKFFFNMENISSLILYKID